MARDAEKETGRPARADAVVVGGGVSGMVAALRVAQSGRDVVVLEKLVEDRYVCNSRLTQGVWHCALADLLDDPKALEARIMEVTGNAARSDLARAVAHDGLRTVRWLQGVGVRFVKGPLDYQSFVLAPPSVTAQGRAWEGRGGDVMLRTLEAELVRQRGRVLRGHRATKLVMSEGRVTGLEGEDANGRPFVIATGNVVIADGGFQANQDLTRRFAYRRPEAVFQRNAKTGMGDGLSMAIEVGAEVTDLQAFYGHVLSRDAFTNERLSPYPFLDYVMSSAIVVDKTARRWVDEGRGGIVVANAIAQSDDPMDKIVIADESIWNDLGKFRLLSPNPWLVKEGGTVHRASSIEELARLCGLDPNQLAATIDAYNAAIRDGTTSALEPGRSVAAYAARPIVTAPFYGVPVCAGITYTMGGIAINADAQVLAPAQKPIPGLYAVGCAAGGLEGGPAIGYVGGLVKSGVTGLRAGEHIVATLEPASTVESEHTQKTYPAVVFFSAHGRRIAAAAAVAVAVATQIPAALGHGATWSIAGLALAAVVWGIARLGAEVVEVVADTLLPR
jgi:fumarate reductase flavoprotein subunit